MRPNEYFDRIDDKHGQNNEASVLSEYRSKSDWLSDLLAKEDKTERDQQRIQELTDSLDQIEDELERDFAWNPEDIKQMRQGRPDYR